MLLKFSFRSEKILDETWAEFTIDKAYARLQSKFFTVTVDTVDTVTKDSIEAAEFRGWIPSAMSFRASTLLFMHVVGDVARVIAK